MSVYEGANASSFKQTEVHLYGSSRLDIAGGAPQIPELLTLAGDFTAAKVVEVKRGEKFFEWSNHLGNVLATVSDRKIAHSSNSSVIDYYTADVISAQDYYPFGMIMPGRVSSSQNGYRYGFNGQEKTTEIFQGSTTALFWEYDSKTARRWNVDPKPTENVSVYATMWSNPIFYNDPLGDTTRVTTKSGKFLFDLNDGTNNLTTLTAKQLYARGIQWFEPLADNYMPIIRMNDKIGNLSELKHFSWSSISDYASRDRWMISYRQRGSGDWKAEGKPGDGYLLVTVNGQPYWADAVGQIPFAIDYFTDRLIIHGNRTKAIRETIQKGREYAEGKLIGGQTDNSNRYDIYFILRGALFAADKYQASKKGKSYEVREGPNPFMPGDLGNRIWYKDAIPYLGLNPKR
jgi:hypothetical protein